MYFSYDEYKLSNSYANDINSFRLNDNNSSMGVNNLMPIYPDYPTYTIYPAYPAYTTYQDYETYRAQLQQQQQPTTVFYVSSDDLNQAAAASQTKYAAAMPFDSLFLNSNESDITSIIRNLESVLYTQNELDKTEKICNFNVKLKK